MYLTFIWPILEYASEVWFNCGQFNSNRLEKVQIEAARIVCGLCLCNSTSLNEAPSKSKLK
jgi:hypothetical protein